MPQGRKNIMLGTAGHVDHGKTALVKVLTGCNTDRLAVEQQRGLTIELGFAPCQMYDDRIVGIVMTGKGVTVHTIDCDTLEQFSDTPERWLDVAWEVDGKEPDTHVGRISVVMVNSAGSLSTMTAVIARNFGNISNLKITNRSSEFYDLLIDIEVHDVKHLADIIAALRATPSINAVERAKG